MVCGGIHEHEGALEIIHQRFVRLLGQIGQQPSEQQIGLVGVSSGVQKNECFADFDVFGPIDVELAHDHQAAKDQQRHEQQKELVLAKESHALFMQAAWPRGNGKRNRPTDQTVLKDVYCLG